MDYPSDPTIQLYDGKFTDGDPANDIPPSEDSAPCMNAVYDELLNVITAGGLTPDENVLTQVRDAVNALINAAVTLAIANLALGTAAKADTGTGTANVPTTAEADGRYGQLAVSNTWTADQRLSNAQLHFQTTANARNAIIYVDDLTGNVIVKDLVSGNPLLTIGATGNIYAPGIVQAGAS